MRRLAFAVLLACSLTVAAHSPVPDGPPKKPAELLVGEWKLVESSTGLPDAATFFVVFTKDGGMTVRIEPKDKKNTETITLKGKYKLKGDDKIDYEIDDGDGGKKTEVLVIKKLTEDDLVVTDPDDIKETFKRVKPAKKEPEKK